MYRSKYLSYLYYSSRIISIVYACFLYRTPDSFSCMEHCS